MLPVSPSPSLSSFVIGALLSLIVSLPARALRWLTRDGTIAAFIVGTLVFGFGGWARAGLLVLFFATSSALTRWQAGRKADREHHAGRTASQVLANGAVVTVLAAWGSMGHAASIDAAFAGAIAAATADTWATEVGLLSASPPRLITTGQRTARGQSGGITWLGTLAGCLGAVVVAGCARWWLHTPILSVVVAGSAAMLFDSVLGAAVEGRRPWITNDLVNLLATTVGATLAAML